MNSNKDIVVLEEYNYNWKQMYQEEYLKLKKLIKKYAIDIQHIDSTSIEGLKAKPIIDIVVTLNELQDFLKFKDNFIKKDGYTIKEDDQNDDYLVIKDIDGVTKYLIHIVENNSERLGNYILFKKCMLECPEKLKEYEKLKEKLARKYRDDRKEYTKAKASFIENIISEMKPN